MGYVKHEAIIVTGWNRAHVRLAQRHAKEEFRGAHQVSSIVESQVNGYYSFLIGPDGSKMGWSHDEVGDETRAAFKDWVLEQANEINAKPMYLNLVEVRYGGDDKDEEVITHVKRECE